jgi:hypothetical protein
MVIDMPVKLGVRQNARQQNASGQNARATKCQEKRQNANVVGKCQHFLNCRLVVESMQAKSCAVEVGEQFVEPVWNIISQVTHGLRKVRHGKKCLSIYHSIELLCIVIVLKVGQILNLAPGALTKVEETTLCLHLTAEHCPYRSKKLRLDCNTNFED